eukprot:TRINITY_DN8387_c0_g2_i4.p1 TRINITY_DN8387_c0_g2~~TRINITY_DN8387_c0_g2_i4.p1  ORF type:complete len:504 (+),score=184.86 TRINITY_DN8387_c0_g2_i4:151-1662(+)
MQAELMQDLTQFCPHKEEANACCLKCATYLCKACQLNDHFDHIECIKGLDAMFSRAVQQYEMMNSELEKTLLKTESEMKDGAIDETLLKIEKKIIEEYDRLHQDIKGIEDDHLAMIENSPLVHRIQELKDSMEDQSYTALVNFDRKLQDTISKLLGALDKEDFESVAPLLTETTKDDFAAEFVKNKPYIERQKQLLKQIDAFREIKPKLVYNSGTIEELVQVKGVHEETVKLLLYCPDDTSVYAHYPKTKEYRKNPLKAKLVLRKFAQVVVEDDTLFFCGGKRKQKEFSNRCFIYECMDQRLTEKASMLKTRSCHAIANKKDEEIYVAGGMNNSGDLASAEVYSVKGNSWKFLPNIPQPKKNCTLCLLFDKYLYLIGGSSAGQVDVLNLHDAKGWETKSIANAHEVEKAGAVQVADNQILVFGGKSGGRKVSSCVVYDLSNGVAIPKAALPVAASFNKADTRKLDGMIYSSGNVKGQTYMYDISSNEWTVITKDKYTLKYSWD